VEVKRLNLPVGIGKVECDEHPDLCRGQKIMAFPNLRWYEKSVATEPDYRSDRTVDSMVGYIQQQIGANAVDNIHQHLGTNAVDNLTSGNFQKWLTEHEIAFVDFYRSEWGPYWESFAEEVKKLNMPVAVGRVDCIMEFNLCHGERAEAFSTLKWYERGTSDTKYTSDRLPAAMVNFARQKLEENQEFKYWEKSASLLGENGLGEPQQGMVRLYDALKEDTNEGSLLEKDEGTMESNQGIPTNIGDYEPNAIYWSLRREEETPEGTSVVFEEGIYLEWFGPRDEPKSNDSPVMELNEWNFHEWLANHETAFVNICKPNCVWCQRLAPGWEKLAAEVQEQKLPVGIGRIDCPSAPQLCTDLGIFAVPTLAWFENSIRTADMYGDRTVENMLYFVNFNLQKTENAEKAVGLRDNRDLYVHQNRDNFHDLLTNHKLLFVNFCRSDCQFCNQLAPHWDALTAEVSKRMMASVGIATIDCNLEYSLCQNEQVTETPSIRLYIDGVHSLDYSGVQTAASMYKFLFDNMKENLPLDGDLYPKELSDSLIEIRDKRALASQQQSAPEPPSCRLTGHLLVDQLPENVHIRTKSSAGNIGTVAKSKFLFRSKEYHGIVVDVEKVLEVHQDEGEGIRVGTLDKATMDDDDSESPHYDDDLYSEFEIGFSEDYEEHGDVEVAFDDASKEYEDVEVEFDDDGYEDEYEYESESNDYREVEVKFDDASYEGDLIIEFDDDYLEGDDASDEYYSGDREVAPSRDQGAEENPEEDEASIDLAKHKSFFGSNLRKNTRTEIQ